jgi:hypothetical protein
MRYCPKCNAEYREGVPACVEDGAILLDRAGYDEERQRRGHAPMPFAHLVPVSTLPSRFEAEQIAVELADAGFDVSLVSTKAGVAAPLTGPLPAEWSIVVPAEQAEKAAGLVAEWRRDLEASTAAAEQAAEAGEAEDEQPHF